MTVDLKPLASVCGIFGVVWVGTTTAIIVTRERRIAEGLRKSGIETEAEVIGLSTTDAPRSGKTAHVTYKYLDNHGNEFTNTEQITGRFYRFLHANAGSKIAVRYLADNPQLARLVGNGSVNLARDMLIVLLVLLIGTLFIAWLFSPR